MLALVACGRRGMQGHVAMFSNNAYASDGVQPIAKLSERAASDFNLRSTIIDLQVLPTLLPFETYVAWRRVRY